MTNRKIKRAKKDLNRYCFENETAYIILKYYYRVIAAMFLGLGELYPNIFYKKKLTELYYALGEGCKEMDEYTDDGVLDYKLEQYRKIYHTDTAACKRIIQKQAIELLHENTYILTDNADILTYNLEYAFISLCSSFGFGEKRLSRLCRYLEEKEFIDPVQQVWDKFGLDLHIKRENADFNKFLPKKKRKATYYEGLQAQRSMAALKAYQEEVMRGDV